MDKPKAMSFYDSTKVNEWLRKKYKFKEHLMHDYVLEAFREIHNGSHLYFTGELLSEMENPEHRRWLQALLDEFGGPTILGRGVYMHYWW